MIKHRLQSPERLERCIQRGAAEREEARLGCCSAGTYDSLQNFRLQQCIAEAAHQFSHKVLGRSAWAKTWIGLDQARAGDDHSVAERSRFQNVVGEVAFVKHCIEISPLLMQPT